MEKNTGSVVLIAALGFLLLGGLFGYVVGSNGVEKEIVTQEVIKEVPTEKIVTKEVTNEVEVFKPELLLDKAVDEFLDEFLDEDLICDGVEYDDDQVEIKDIDDDYSLRFDDDEQEANFHVKVKYLDNDVEKKCYNEYDVSVLYEEDEEPVVNY